MDIFFTPFHKLENEGLCVVDEFGNFVKTNEQGLFLILNDCFGGYGIY